MSLCLSEENLQAYIDGELSEAAAGRVMAHLAECRKCTRRVSEAEQAFSEISSKLDDHLPAIIPVERLSARVEAVVASPVRWQSAMTFSWRLGLAAASLLIVIGSVAWLVLPAKISKQVSIIPSGEKGAGANTPDSQDSGTIEQLAKAPGPRGKPGGRRMKPKVKSPQLATNPVELSSPIPVRESREEAYFFDFETTRHLEKAEVLLRSIENVPLSLSAKELAYDKQVSRELLIRNILLRREAEDSMNAPAKSLLGSLEPLLLDIANLPARPQRDELLAVKKRIQRSEIVAVLQVF
jgi:Putative zinc-finger